MKNKTSMAYFMNKISSYRENNIKVLSERLESLQIMDKASESTNEQTDIEMLTAQALA